MIEDIAHDLYGVSEWAVIIACKEMRQKQATWYPTTGEIEDLVRSMQDSVDTLVTADQPVQAVKAIDDDRAGKRFDQVDRARLLECHRIVITTGADGRLPSFFQLMTLRSAIRGTGIRTGRM